jgi:hydrogenase-4 component H
MNIFRLLAKNLGIGPITLRYPNEVSQPGDFRGLVKINVDECICCGMCDYVCVSEAVIVTQYEKSCDWSYYPGRCTFCGKCVEICPSMALSHEPKTAPSYLKPEALKEVHRVAYPVCLSCGRTAQPVTKTVLARAFAEVSEDIIAISKLCPRCRQKRYVKELSSAIKTASPLKKKL